MLRQAGLVERGFAFAYENHVRNFRVCVWTHLSENGIFSLCLFSLIGAFQRGPLFLSLASRSLQSLFLVRYIHKLFVVISGASGTVQFTAITTSLPRLP